jgi:hypothetical protein
MSNELPVLKPIEPAAKCGACGGDVYPHSEACPRPDCPLRGIEWLRYQYGRRMQNLGASPAQNENATSPKGEP